MKERVYFIRLEEEAFRKAVSFTPSRPDKNIVLYYRIPRRAAIVCFMSFSFLSIRLFYLLYELLISSLLHVCSLTRISGFPQLFISLLHSQHFHSAGVLEILVWEYYNIYLTYCFLCMVLIKNVVLFIFYICWNNRPTFDKFNYLNH
jgi:hypothetical protein